MPGEQSASVSALGKWAGKVDIVSYSQKWSTLKFRGWGGGGGGDAEKTKGTTQKYC